MSVLLLGIVIWTFFPALHNGFLNYDDPDYVTANPHVQSGLTRESIKWAWTSTTASNWHPLTWLSHMLDCQLFGLKPAGHHLTSVLLHAANTALLFLVLRRLTGAVGKSLFVAALFGLHPLRLESVAWIAERKDVLSAFFGLLSLWAYARYVRKSKVQSPPIERARPNSTLDPRPSTLDYGLALVFFALSLMSKPMLVTLPFVLLLLDYWPLGRVTGYKFVVSGLGFQVPGSGGPGPGASAAHNSKLQTPNAPPPLRLWRLALEKTPFLLLTVASCVVTLVVQKRGGALAMMAGQPWPARVENAVVSYSRYLGHFFWPQNLSVLYPVVDWPGLTVAFAAVLLLVLSCLAVVLRRQRPYLFTGWFWFLGTLVPVIGLIPAGEQSLADRYTYFPMIGVGMLLAWGAEDLTRRWPYRVVGLPALGGAVLIVCVALTREHLGYWRNSETLFRHALEVTQQNYRACASLGSELLDQGRTAEAIVAFEQAAKFKPDSADAHNNLGAALAIQGRFGEAVSQFRRSLELNPGNALTHLNAGTALEKNGRLDEAIPEYREAVKLKPDFAVASRSLGAALMQKGLLEEAIAQFREVLRLVPGDGSTHDYLGLALQKQGRVEEAAAQFQEALRLNPGDASARDHLDLLRNGRSP